MEILSEYIPIELLDKVVSKSPDREYHYGKFFFIHRGLGYTFYYGSCKIATVYNGRCVKKVTYLRTEDIQFLPYIDNDCDIIICKMSEKVFKQLLSSTLLRVDGAPSFNSTLLRVDGAPSFNSTLLRVDGAPSFNSTLLRVDGAPSFNIHLCSNQLKTFLILSRRFGNLRAKQMVLHYGSELPKFIYLNRISCIYLSLGGLNFNNIDLRGMNNEIFIADINRSLDITKVENYQRMLPNAICINFFERNIVNKDHILYNEETADLIRINDMDKLTDYYVDNITRFSKTKSAAKK
jgi:hypothetical protein